VNHIKYKHMKYNLIIITGPTASGKTSLAVKLAHMLESEIISADSRQVYKGLDIGTGKDLEEYVVDNKIIPHHLIDVVEPDEDFDLFRFYKSFFELFEKFTNNGRIPILAGGTPLYIHSIISNYKLIEVPENNKLREELNNMSLEELGECLKSLQPALHNITDLETRERAIRAIEIARFRRENPNVKSMGEDIEIRPFIMATDWDRPVLKKRITERLEKRLKEGMIEEVERLHGEGCSWERLEYFGLEYKYLSLYLRNMISYKEMFETLNIRIHQFSKKQMGWFRKFEREGFKIHWIEKADFHTAAGLIRNEFSL